jgi:hypothetical protein
VERVEARARAEGLAARMQVQQAPMDALPYRAGVFDVAVAELGLTARADPAEAIREVVRVVRPGGRVVLVQLVWRAPVDPERREVLARHLGAQPLMTMEVKKILRGAGVERLHTEAWTDAETSFRGEAHKPFPDFAELFTLPEKLGILRRAWRRWGWRGVREAMARELEVHRLLTRERILGLDMISGLRTESPDAPTGSDAPSADAPTAESSPPTRRTLIPRTPDPLHLRVPWPTPPRPPRPAPRSGSARPRGRPPRRGEGAHLLPTAGAGSTDGCSTTSATRIPWRTPFSVWERPPGVPSCSFRRTGDPVLLRHAIEASSWRGWPWESRTYAGWQELEAALASLLAGMTTVAMEVSARSAVPTVDRVPFRRGGTGQGGRRPGGVVG